MVNWEGPDKSIVWTKRGLRTRTALRWFVATLLALAIAMACTVKWG